MVDVAPAQKWCGELRVILKLGNSSPSSSSSPSQAIGAVNYAKLLLRWREAQARAQANLKELGRQLLALPEVQNDPRLEQVQRAAARLPTLIPSFGEQLADQLDLASNGGPSASDSQTAALATIRAYRKQLAAVPVLEKLAVFARKNLNADLPSASELDSALASIESALLAAAKVQETVA